jgi:metallo-beta-lactamase family protein
MHEVNARIARIDAFSGHGDYNEMIEFLECQDKELIRTVFLVHGEYEVQKNYRQKLLEKGYRTVIIPAFGEEFEI